MCMCGLIENEIFSFESDYSFINSLFCMVREIMNRKMKKKENTSHQMIVHLFSMV